MNGFVQLRGGLLLESSQCQVSNEIQGSRDVNDCGGANAVINLKLFILSMSLHILIHVEVVAVVRSIASVLRGAARSACFPFQLVAKEETDP